MKREKRADTAQEKTGTGEERREKRIGLGLIYLNSRGAVTNKSFPLP
jgi:hypothetical protein